MTLHEIVRLVAMILLIVTSIVCIGLWKKKYGYWLWPYIVHVCLMNIVGLLFFRPWEVVL